MMVIELYYACHDYMIMVIIVIIRINNYGIAQKVPGSILTVSTV